MVTTKKMMHKKKMPKKMDSVMESMGHEMKVNPPSILAKTKKKSGAKKAEKQRKAILLNKVKKAGAKTKKY